MAEVQRDFSGEGERVSVGQCIFSLSHVGYDAKLFRRTFFNTLRNYSYHCYNLTTTTKCEFELTETNKSVIITNYIQFFILYFCFCSEIFNFLQAIAV